MERWTIEVSTETDRSLRTLLPQRVLKEGAARRVSCHPLSGGGSRRLAEIVEPVPGVASSPDPDDYPIIASAVACRAQYLVTGDKNELFALMSVGGVRIVAAREPLELMP